MGCCRHESSFEIITVWLMLRRSLICMIHWCGTKRRCSSSLSFQGKKLPLTLPSAGNGAMVPCNYSSCNSSRVVAGSNWKKRLEMKYPYIASSYFCSFSLSFFRNKCLASFEKWFSGLFQQRDWQTGSCWKAGGVCLNVGGFVQGRKGNLCCPLSWLRNSGTSDGSWIPCSYIHSSIVIGQFLMTRIGKSTFSTVQ